MKTLITEHAAKLIQSDSRSEIIEYLNQYYTPVYSPDFVTFAGLESEATLDKLTAKEVCSFADGARLYEISKEDVRLFFALHTNGGGDPIIKTEVGELGELCENTDQTEKLMSALEIEDPEKLGL